MLTPEQVLSLAPDDSSSKAAKGLIVPSKWPRLGADEGTLWGECQGSGSKPYQVIINLDGPSFRCSCPSRKFPCKHGLALFLLRLQKESAFTDPARPDWVAEWLDGRRDRAEKKSAKAAAQTDGPSPAPVDPEAAARREAKRLDRMQAGARDLGRWLADRVRQGMSDFPSKPSTFWAEPAARLVDAQASGLAAAVRDIESAASSGEGWPERVLARMGRAQLLCEALARYAELPPALQTETRSAAGWAMDKEDVLASGERVTDTWVVEGISHEENDRLWERRVWLRGSVSGRPALLLDFSHGGRRFEQSFVSGTTFEADLAYFPAAHPLRALAAEIRQNGGTPADAAPVPDWDAALAPVAKALGRCPWLQRLPLRIDQATPVLRGHRFVARDPAGREMPLRVRAEDGWEILALGGGHPLRWFGEWLGDQFRPLTLRLADSPALVWAESVPAA